MVSKLSCAIDVDRLTPLPALMLCCETAHEGTKYRSTYRSDTPDCNRICSSHRSVDITYASTTGCEHGGAKEACDESESQQRSEVRCQRDRQL